MVWNYNKWQFIIFEIRNIIVLQGSLRLNNSALPKTIISATYSINDYVFSNKSTISNDFSYSILNLLISWVISWNGYILTAEDIRTSQWYSQWEKTCNIEQPCIDLYSESYTSLTY